MTDIEHQARSAAALIGVAISVYNPHYNSWIGWTLVAPTGYEFDSEAYFKDIAVRKKEDWPGILAVLQTLRPIK